MKEYTVNYRGLKGIYKGQGLYKGSNKGIKEYTLNERGLHVLM